MPKPAKIVTPIVKENEYLDVRLYLDGKAHHRYVHRLVATAFIGEPPFEDAEVMHKDDCRSNNNVSNLKWGTHRENECDKLRKVRQARGSRQGLSILSEDSVVKIADDLRNGVLVKEIASKFGIDARNVKHIRDGNSWSHVTGIKKSRKTLID